MNNYLIRIQSKIQPSKQDYLNSFLPLEYHTNQKGLLIVGMIPNLKIDRACFFA